MLDFNLEGINPSDKMPIHAAVFSSELIRIVELVASEGCTLEAKIKLKERKQAIEKHIKKFNEAIRVQDIIFFPSSTTSQSSVFSGDDSILYRDELQKLITLPEPTYPIFREKEVKRLWQKCLS